MVKEPLAIEKYELVKWGGFFLVAMTILIVDTAKTRRDLESLRTKEMHIYILDYSISCP